MNGGIRRFLKKQATEGAVSPFPPIVITSSYCSFASPPLRLANVVIFFGSSPDRFRIAVDELDLLSSPTPMAVVSCSTTPSLDNERGSASVEMVYAGEATDTFAICTTTLAFPEGRSTENVRSRATPNMALELYHL